METQNYVHSFENKKYQNFFVVDQNLSVPQYTNLNLNKNHEQFKTTPLHSANVLLGSELRGKNGNLKLQSLSS